MWCQTMCAYCTRNCFKLGEQEANAVAAEEDGAAAPTAEGAAAEEDAKAAAAEQQKGREATAARWFQNSSTLFKTLKIKPSQQTYS